jgi:hypothetical protein
VVAGPGEQLTREPNTPVAATIVITTGDEASRRNISTCGKRRSGRR